MRAMTCYSYVPWLIHVCTVSRAYLCRDAFICLMHIWPSWNMTYLCMCAMTHPYVYHDSCIPVTHSYVWYPPWITHSYRHHDSCIRVLWRIYDCAMTYPYDLFIQVTWMYVYVRMCTCTHVYMWCVLVHIRMNLYIYKNTHINVCIYIHICTHTHTHIRM